MAPVCIDLKKTIEDPYLTDEKKRLHLFGQEDHLRLYSHDDYVLRLEEPGFIVKQLDSNFFGLNTFKKLGLKQTSILYIVQKI